MTLQGQLIWLNGTKTLSTDSVVYYLWSIWLIQLIRWRLLILNQKKEKHEYFCKVKQVYRSFSLEDSSSKFFERSFSAEQLIIQLAIGN